MQAKHEFATLEIEGEALGYGAPACCSQFQKIDLHPGSATVSEEASRSQLRYENAETSFEFETALP